MKIRPTISSYRLFVVLFTLAAGLPLAFSWAAPGARFTVNANGSVKDNRTGLSWLRCTVGFKGANCAEGQPQKQTWEDAVKTCADLNAGAGTAGSKNWRLPAIEELWLLADRTRNKPAIDDTAFPATINGAYWSITEVVFNKKAAWFVDFGIGSDGGSAKADPSFTRCVSGP